MVKHSQSSQNSKFQMSLQYLKKEVRDEVDFYHVDKHQGFLQVAFNTLGIKIPHKMILSLLMGMIKHSQSTESNKFAISLQCLKKEVGDGVLFLYAGKHQSFHNLVLLFLMKVARYVQHAQTGKLVIFLLYLMKKKKKVLELLLCSIKRQNVHIFYRNPIMFIVTCFTALNTNFSEQYFFLKVRIFE